MLCMVFTGWSFDHYLYRISRFAINDSKYVQNFRRIIARSFHVSARALAAHALSIFGDHQDVLEFG